MLVKRTGLSRYIFGNALHEIRGEVAKNEKTTYDILAILSYDQDSWVRGEVVKNPNASSETVIRLARDKNSGVRYNLTERQKPLPEKVYNQLVNDPSLDVRRGLVLNKATLDYVLEVLGLDLDRTMAEEAASKKTTHFCAVRRASSFPDSARLSLTARSQ